MNPYNFLESILNTYSINEKWLPFLLVAIAIIVILCIYVIFFYIRAFISWIFGVSEIAHQQKENNRLIQELIYQQNEIIFQLEQLNTPKNTENIENEIIIDDTDFIGESKPESITIDKNTETIDTKNSQKKKKPERKLFAFGKKNTNNQ